MPVLFAQVVILETKAARLATKDILTMHYITHDRSEELRVEGQCS